MTPDKALIDEMRKVADLSEMQKAFERQEPLHPELRPYLSEVSGMPMIRHPRIYSVPHFEQMNAFVNLRFKFLQRMFESAHKKMDFDAMLSLTERPYRLEVFYHEISSVCGPKKYWRILGELYTDCENIYQNAELWEELLFEEEIDGYRKNFMRSKNMKVYESLPEEMTIYRGTQTEYWKGFSWTLDKDRAIWFASRFEHQPGRIQTLTTATVRKEFVLGYFGGRNEQEIVCHFDNVNVISHEKIL